MNRALAALRAARRDLVSAGAPRAAARVRAALKSAEGAKRHLQHRLARSVSTTPGLMVCVHAWRYDGDNQTYADATAGEPHDGWTVYLRREPVTEGHPFHVDVDEDFDTQEAACAFADQIAKEYGCATQFY